MFVGGRLQLVLDHPDGTTLAHCEEVAKKASAVLDVVDFGSSKYVLEVSSPGMDRKLYGPRDYQRFAGHLTRITWADQERGKRTDVGRLESPTDDESLQSIRLSLEDGASLDVALADILEARLEIEI